MGLPYGINNRGNQLTYKDSELILSRAFSEGIKLLDTAEVYGNAHHVIGEFHQKHPEIRFGITTKVPKNLTGDIEKKIYEYIDVLKIDKLDGLMFHAHSTLKSNPEVLDKLVTLKNKNIINKIGVSVYTNDELEDLLYFDAIDLIQLPFNLLDNLSIRGELLKKAKKRNKIIHTRSAFLQGLFFKDADDENKIVQALHQELLLLNKISENEQITMASLALNYCLQEKLIDNVLIGVDSIDQLTNNLSIVGQSISSKTIEQINNIKVKNQALLNPSLWN